MKDQFITAVLERYTPPANDALLDWRDVLYRAQSPTPTIDADAAGRNGASPLRNSSLERGRHRRVGNQRRRLAIAASAALLLGLLVLLTPVGPALARSLDGFASWIGGSPGEPAAHAEQQAFSRATRSWAGFPAGTELRRLAETRSAGFTFTLYGFRGAGSLCLRLDVTGADAARELSCLPLSELKARAQPVFVVAADYGVGPSTQKPTSAPFVLPTPATSLTYGIVADGVKQIEFRYSNGTTSQALVSGDAFLAINPHPSTSERVTNIWAKADGRRVAIPFAPTPTLFGGAQTTGPQLQAHGPARVQKVVHGGAIGWLARRQPRGTPVPTTVHHVAGVQPNVIFSRLITPDPAAPERMVVSVLPAGDRYGGGLQNPHQVCAELVGGRYAGGGCWPAGRLFSTAPFSWGLNQRDQYVTIAGLASDDVARLALYDATGGRVTVPLHDNGYIVEAARTTYPLRLVAYDNANRVIGVVTFKGDGGRRPRARPVPNARWRTVIRNAAGAVLVAPSTSGGSCYAFQLHTGAATLSCPPPLTRSALEASLSTDSNSVTVTGRAGTAIARVAIRFRDGHTATITPRQGFLLATIPRSAATGPAPAIDTTVGFDAAGREIARHTFTRLLGGTGVIRAISTEAITIGTSDTACRRTTSSPPLDGYHPGVRVRYLCQNGSLTLIGRSSAGTRWADRTIWAKGPITAITPTSITIYNELAAADRAGTATLTCSLSDRSPSISRYARGQQVQVFCSRGALTGINYLSG